MRAWAMATSLLLSAVRGKLLLLAAVTSVLVMGLSFLIGPLSLGTGEKITRDLGLANLLLCSAFLILWGCGKARSGFSPIMYNAFRMPFSAASIMPKMLSPESDGSFIFQRCSHACRTESSVIGCRPGKRSGTAPMSIAPIWLFSLARA